MLDLDSHGHSRGSFNPHGARLNMIRDFSQFSNGKLTEAIAKDQHLAVADFEFSVERYLELWVPASTNDKGAPEVIGSCIQQYHAGAKGLYGSNPEYNSIMILTIMYLWVALDRLAVDFCPLLKQYSPKIPSDFLHDLLLH